MNSIAKQTGSHYTPRGLAQFVADRMCAEFSASNLKGKITILDPAVGNGELVVALIERLSQEGCREFEVHGYDVDPQAIEITKHRLEEDFPTVNTKLQRRDFLEILLEDSQPLWNKIGQRYDLVIANPPYVRTQVLGAKKAKSLSRMFGLSGRIDLYYPFLLGIADMLSDCGICGIIVSNRFMTTRSGKVVRKGLHERFDIRQVFDLGDTKLFQAAVLPAVLIMKRKTGSPIEQMTSFISMYETPDTPAKREVTNLQEAVSAEGTVQIPNSGTFRIKLGTLQIGDDHEEVWRIANDETDNWLETVEQNTYCHFGELGKIKVGVKTTADRVFIRDDWENLPVGSRPELLLSLTTGKTGRRFRPLQAKPSTKILYPHAASTDGKRYPVNLHNFPKSEAYLKKFRKELEGREYVVQSGRKWYEIWVPHNPQDWKKPKLVFRDIVKQPVAWLDFSGSVINGDCYWMALDKGKDPDLLWLCLAICNSKFIEEFYDRKFHNKLYAGRRRFISQYVELFPIPNPQNQSAKDIVALAKEIYDATGFRETSESEALLNSLINRAFGLLVEEIGR